MTGRSIITPWSFRDGKDYIITFIVNGHPSSLGLKVADKITAEEWTCSYDDKSIESLTHRTGSFKSFDTFASMLKSAILKKSDSVALDLMTFQDLEILLSQKKQTSNNYGQQTTSASTTSYFSYAEEEKSQGASSKKRFLIMTYVSEFDTVRYPIPLNYAGPPDPVILQNNIKRLQTEVTTLRNAKEALEEQVNHLKLAQQQQPPPPRKHSSEVSIPRSLPVANDPNEEANVNSKANAVTANFSPHHNHNERLGQMNRDPNNNWLRNSNSNNYKDCNQEDEIVEQRLIEHIKNLEEKFKTQKRDHQQDKMKIAELEAENAFLSRKLQDFEALENDLHSEIQQLRTQVTCLQQESNLNKRFSSGRGRPPPYGSRACRNTRGIPTRYGRDNHYYEEYESDMDITGKRNKSWDTFNNRKHRPIRDLKTEISSTNFNKHSTYKRYNDSSPSPVGGVRKTAAAICRSRSNSSTRQPKFDPTAYITEKKLKQEKIAKMRLERVNSSLSLRSNSSDGRTRSKSISLQSDRLNRGNNVSSFQQSKDQYKRTSHQHHSTKHERIGIKSRHMSKPPTLNKNELISHSSDSNVAEVDSNSNTKSLHNAGDTIDDITHISEVMTGSVLDPSEISPSSMRNKKSIPVYKKPLTSLASGIRDSLNLSPSLTLGLLKQKQNKIGTTKKKNKKKSMSPTRLGRIRITKPGIRFTDSKISKSPRKYALDPDVHLDPATITALNCIFNPSSRQRTA